MAYATPPRPQRRRSGCRSSPSTADRRLRAPNCVAEQFVMPAASNAASPPPDSDEQNAASHRGRAAAAEDVGAPQQRTQARARARAAARTCRVIRLEDSDLLDHVDDAVGHRRAAFNSLGGCRPQRLTDLRRPGAVRPTGGVEHQEGAPVRDGAVVGADVDLPVSRRRVTWSRHRLPRSTPRTTTRRSTSRSLIRSAGTPCGPHRRGTASRCNRPARQPRAVRAVASSCRPPQRSLTP